VKKYWRISKNDLYLPYPKQSILCFQRRKNPSHPKCLDDHIFFAYFDKLEVPFDPSCPSVRFLFPDDNLISVKPFNFSFGGMIKYHNRADGIDFGLNYFKNGRLAAIFRFSWGHGGREGGMGEGMITFLWMIQTIY